MNEDERIQDIAVAMIRRCSMNPEEWRFTQIAMLHADIHLQLQLADDELVLVSAFFSDASWYVFTTRRIISKHKGKVAILDPRHGFEAEFGNFKGYPNRNIPQLAAIPTGIAVLRNSRATLQFEYETGNASMASIYATKYWSQKHPILHKLLTTAEQQSFKNRRV